MGGTADEPHYRAMTRAISAGDIGAVRQIIVQKSYPLHSGRPIDEDVDGGLVRQVGIHAFRLIEHLTGVPIGHIDAGTIGTRSEITSAASILLRLTNGVIGSVALNYLNPRGTGIWGNDEVRVFGTAGMVESTDGGRRTRLVVGDNDLGPLPLGPAQPSYFDLFCDHVLDGTEMPRSIEDELHPLRVAIRAHIRLGR